MTFSFSCLFKKKKDRVKPRLITAERHGIDPNQLSRQVKSILSHLNTQGYQAYIVGGGVRDLLVGQDPQRF